jgi:hypothetical protein
MDCGPFHSTCFSICTRTLLWAIVERQPPLSSLTADDAVGYRAFLRRPAPRGRWTGQPCSRRSAGWRPFAHGLSPRSAAYSLSVLPALFRWLIEQCYVLAHPFAGIKIELPSRASAFPLSPSDSNRPGQLSSVSDEKAIGLACVFARPY